MERLNKVFIFEEANEDYVKKLQKHLDELEELVLHAEGELPIWKIANEINKNNLAYTIINLILSNEAGELSEKKYREINNKIDRAAVEKMYLNLRALAEQN